MGSQKLGRRINTDPNRSNINPQVSRHTTVTDKIQRLCRASLNRQLNCTRHIATRLCAARFIINHLNCYRHAKNNNHLAVIRIIATKTATYGKELTPLCMKPLVLQTVLVAASVKQLEYQTGYQDNTDSFIFRHPSYSGLSLINTLPLLI